MKKIWFVLSVLVMIMVVGCSNPTNSDSGSDDEVVTQTSDNPQTPVEDKSPFEYVKPACVDLADYTYVGDYIFADSMNFAEWKYSNSETGYLLAFEKIARVKNDNPATRIIRYPHNATSEDDAISVVKATKYKIYVKTSVLENVNINDVAINLYNSPFDDTYDGSRIRILKNSNDDFTVSFADDNDISNYVVY